MRISRAGCSLGSLGGWFDAGFWGEFRCIDKGGAPSQTIGRATPVNGKAGQLEVSFLPEFLRWIPFTNGDYWVLKIDDAYTVALVGTPDYKCLWLLARDLASTPSRKRLTSPKRPG